MVNQGHSQGVLDEAEKEMINSVIAFDEISAEEVMTPRTEVFTIDVNDRLQGTIRMKCLLLSTQGFQLMMKMLTI